MIIAHHNSEVFAASGNISAVLQQAMTGVSRCEVQVQRQRGEKFGKSCVFFTFLDLAVKVIF